MNVVVRSLEPDEARQLVAARLVAVEHAPYLAHALFGVTPLAADGLGTFAVDRGWRLYLDPATLSRWGRRSPVECWYTRSATWCAPTPSARMRLAPTRTKLLGAGYRRGD